MKFNLSPTLQNAKVILRPLQPSDEAELQPIANDKACWMYSPTDLSQPGELRKYITEAIAEREAGTCMVFTIIDVATNCIAGTTRLAEISWQHEHAHLGWTWIAPEFRGTGLNKAMKFEILRYGFEVLGLNRIQLRADERNIRSCKAIAGLGAKYEGTVRQHLKLYDGFLRSSAYYSILKSEWADSPLWMTSI
ncbi:GNAT family N-acetyltransferase [Mucilaginibacter sp. JRF]|uniref:GNAT family N-acetyltransferase n=1 Tax=Mucilaginibacter sp. JRF TaxID=2780088 RepID=UPI00187E456A|nr:GNAT family protein [Mucilaginibacter sp. JRF]MBE9584346.1 GNAT family N-acetyltransferase [Mucilaginibacter sp. JRF]